MNHPRRPLYRHADLTRLLAPGSIAIVGILSNPDSSGARALANLGRFRGSLYRVDSKCRRIDDKSGYATIDSLPEVPDCVIVALPREAVEDAVADCARAGVGGAVILASGIADAHDPACSAMQARLSELASRSRMPIIGPHCVGVVNFMSGAAATVAESAQYGFVEALPPESRRIGLISQSGSVAFSLSLAVQRGVAFSHVLTSGNSADVDIADCVSYLADDPDCHAIACLIKGVPDPERFLEAADIAWSADKPLVVHKIATCASGAAAALSHAGMRAGSKEAYRALFDRGGVICVDHLEALIETAAFFARARRMKTRGVAVSTSSGGLAVMSADKAEAHGVPLPQPSEAIRAKLAALIPDFGAARNPCDVTAAIVNDRTLLSAAGDAFLSDPAYGALIVTHPLPWDIGPRVAALAELVQRHDKMICNILTGEWLEAPGTKEVERNPLTTVFRSLDRCFATLAAWHHREDQRATWQAGGRPAAADAPERIAPSAAIEAAARLLQAAADVALTEREAKAVLSEYGVPVGTKSAAQSVAGTVTEFRVSARIDLLFGPLIIAGLRGKILELLQDTTTELAPVNQAQALAMLDRLQGRAVLNGFRGSEPVDLERLAGIICRLSELAADQCHRIAEFDVELLIRPASQIAAVDARIVLARNG